MQHMHIKESAESHPLLKVKATAIENRSWRMKQARECSQKLPLEIELQQSMQWHAPFLLLLMLLLLLLLLLLLPLPLILLLAATAVI
jgi:hypothetical protein